MSSVGAQVHSWERQNSHIVATSAPTFNDCKKSNITGKGFSFATITWSVSLEKVVLYDQCVVLKRTNHEK